MAHFPRFSYSLEILGIGEQTSKVFEKGENPAHSVPAAYMHGKRVEAWGDVAFSGTNGTHQDFLPTKNMGATGAIRNCSNSEEVRAKSATGSEENWLDRVQSGACIQDFIFAIVHSAFIEVGIMSEAFDAELIAPCGMNCGICVAFFGYTMSGRRRKHPCGGCRSRDKQCAFIKKHCDKPATNQIEYCYECPGFPCENLRTLDKRYREKYGMSMIENLEYIRTNGIKQFLKNEQERWKCPNCGGVVCVHNKTCYTCSKTQN